MPCSQLSLKTRELVLPEELSWRREAGAVEEERNEELLGEGAPLRLKLRSSPWEKESCKCVFEMWRDDQ